MPLLDRLASFLRRLGPPASTGAMPDELRPVHEALQTVLDPELGIDVVAMGMIRSIALTGDHADVKMTLTRRTCPASQLIVQQVRHAVEQTGRSCEVELVFDPPWSPDDMAPEARVRFTRPGG